MPHHEEWSERAAHDETQKRLGRIEKLLRQLNKGIEIMTINTAALTDAVAANTAATAANTDATNAAIAAGIGGGSGSDQPAQDAIDAATAALGTNTGVVAENTAKLTSAVQPAP